MNAVLAYNQSNSETSDSSCVADQRLQPGDQPHIGSQRLSNQAYLQAKLTIGGVGDEYEREADRVAETVVGMPAPPDELQKKSLRRKNPVSLQRQCISCLPRAEEEESQSSIPIQRKAKSQSAPSNVDNGFLSRINGRPLPVAVRNYFEPRFGRRFDQVRIQTDKRGAELANSIQARAFTVGNDIVFARNQYSLETFAGKKLLAHELTHTIQQGTQTLRSKPMLQAKANKSSVSEFMSAGWREVKRLGIVYHEKGAYLRERPGVDGRKLRKLKQNTRMFVLSEGASREKQGKGKWYAVSLLGNRGGEFGYVSSKRIVKNLPFPQATVTRIYPGETLHGIVTKYSYDQDMRYLGMEARYVMEILELANHNARKLSSGKVGFNKTDNTFRWYKPINGTYMWLMSRDYMRVFYNARTASKVFDDSLWAQVKHTAKKIYKVAAYGLGFVGGLVHGFVKAIYDVVAGLAGMTKDVLVSIFTGSVLSDAKALWNSVSTLSWKDIEAALGAFAKKWEKKLNSSNPWEAGHAHGFLTGYMFAEFVQLFFAPVKAAVWSSRFGKTIKASKAFKKLMKTVAKVSRTTSKAHQSIGKIGETLRKSKPFVSLVAARNWVRGALSLSANTVQDLSLEGINKLRMLSDKALNKLSRFSEAIKRKILACASPCKVHLDDIRQNLDSYAMHIKKPDDLPVIGHMRKGKPVIQSRRENLRQRMKKGYDGFKLPAWASNKKPTNWNAHHVIPWEFLHHGVFHVLREKGLMWDHNTMKNAIALPIRKGISGAENLPVHQAGSKATRGHPVYNAKVEQRLGDILKKFEDNPLRLKKAVEDLLVDLKGELEMGKWADTPMF